MAAPRIAVVGAGTSGIAMGAILARELGTKVSISVLERAPQVRDEGYGLDLDENGQLALVRAGVYHRYWDICVPQSDTYAIYNVVGEEPLARIFQPRLLQFLFPRYFAARPETNRSGMRDLLLESIEQSEGSHRVIYDCKVQGIREKADGNKSARVVELLGPNEEVIGEYDFVIDASGLHSPLRLNRVSDSEGVTFSNRAFLHGMYQNPEAVLSPELMQRIGKNGTTAVLGQGYSFFFQRYGAGPDDPRLCFFYFRTGIADENSIYQEIGFEKQTSRAAGHLTPGDPRMEKAQVWLRQDMEGAVDPIWIEAIDKLDCLTVRNEYSHGDNTSLLPNVTMPIVSIGDALCHAGLGGGGVMALQDSLELADLIVEKLTSAQYEAGKMNMRELLGPELVKKEEIMLSRKLKHRESRKLAKWLERGENFDKTNASIAFNQHPSFLFRWGMPVIARIFKWWYNLEHLVYGGVGSTQKSNIYSVVRKELKKQKTI